MKKESVIFLFFVFAGLSFCCRTVVYAEQDPCSNIVTSQQVFDCSVEKIKNADIRLNKAYKNLKGRVSLAYKADPKLGGVYIEKIRNAQRAWLHLRDLTCPLEAFEIEPGTQAYHSVVNNCFARMEDDRSTYLDHLAN